VAFIFRLSPQGDKPHPIDNFIFKNWDIKMDMSKNKKNYLVGAQSESPITSLIFQNFKINDKVLTSTNYMDLGRFNVKNCAPIIFK
jgi:hypothetical protein